MSQYIEINLSELLALSEELGATKKLQVLLFCMKSLQDNGEVQLHVSQTAEMLGCAREHVSRVLSDLEAKGILERINGQGAPGRKGRRFRMRTGLVRESVLAY